MFGGITQLLSDWYIGQHVGAKPTVWSHMFWNAAKLYKDAYSSFFEPKSYFDEKLRPDVLAALDVSLKMMKGWADERKAKLIALYYPMTQFPKAVNPMADDVKAVVQKYAIPIIDMAPIFNKVPNVAGRVDYPWSIERDGHPSVLGHRLMADAIRQFLKRDSASAATRH